MVSKLMVFLFFLDLVLDIDGENYHSSSCR